MSRSRLDPEQRSLVEAICAEAMEIPPDLRDALIRNRASGDAAVETEVFELIRLAMSDEAAFLSQIDVEMPETQRPKAAEQEDHGAAITIPHHKLIKRLGAGGFGEVWLARHELTEHFRACKIITSRSDIELEGLRSLKRRIPPHPGLFPIEEVGMVDDQVYCLMPLAENANDAASSLDHSSYSPLTLHEHLRRHGALSVNETTDLGKELASALEHLHGHGVVHGDVKPANILRHHGSWLITDYGVLRDISTPNAALACTPDYTPPEGPGDRSADQYALAVVLAQCLTGIIAPAEAIRQLTIDHESQGSKHLAHAQQSISRALSHTAGDRFRSMREFAESLRPQTRASRPVGSRFFGIALGPILIGVFACLALVVSLPMITTSGDSDDPRSSAEPLANSDVSGPVDDPDNDPDSDDDDVDGTRATDGVVDQQERAED